MVKPKEKGVEINRNSIDSINQNNTIPSQNNNKVTGNPNKMIQEQPQAQNSNQNMQQAIKLEDIDPMLIKEFKNLQNLCMQNSFKYMDISSDFKRIGEAFGSYWQILEAKQQQVQKMMAEHNKRNQQNNSK